MLKEEYVTELRKTGLQWLEKEGKTVRGSVLHVGSKMDSYRYVRFFPHATRYRNLDKIKFENVDIVADIQNMPNVLSESENCIVATFMLHLVPNMRKALREFKRVLKTNGILLVTFISRDYKGTVGHHRCTEKEATTLVSECFKVVSVEPYFEDNKLICTFIKARKECCVLENSQGRTKAWWIREGENQIQYITNSTGLREGKLLDVGCGKGHVVHIAAKHGFDARGLEPDTKRVGFPIKYDVACAENMPYRSNSFDVVSCLSVLEHVQNVGQSIRELYRVTKKGGKIYISVPNFLFPYEHHFHFPFFPMPRKLAYAYFKATERLWRWTCKRLNDTPPTTPSYANSLQFTLTLSVKKAFAKQGAKVEVASSIHRPIHRTLVYLGIYLGACFVVTKT